MPFWKAKTIKAPDAEDADTRLVPASFKETVDRFQELETYQRLVVAGALTPEQALVSLGVDELSEEESLESRVRAKVLEKWG